MIVELLAISDHVSWNLRAAVEISVVDRKLVDVVKYEAVEAVRGIRLRKPDVHEGGSVEELRSQLLYNEDAVVEKLSLKEPMHVVEKDAQMSLSVRIGYYNCQPLPSNAFARSPATAFP